MVSVAQLVVAPGCGLGGRGFKSHRSPQKYQGIAENLQSLYLLILLFPHTIFPTPIPQKAFLIGKPPISAGHLVK